MAPSHAHIGARVVISMADGQLPDSVREKHRQPKAPDEGRPRDYCGNSSGARSGLTMAAVTASFSNVMRN